MGPMFRQEKPQKGRQRQFHQFGAEAIGSSDPKIDAETIADQRSDPARLRCESVRSCDQLGRNAGDSS